MNKLTELFQLVDAGVEKYNQNELPTLRESADFERPEDGSMPDIGDLTNFATHLARHFTVKSVMSWQFGWYVVMLVTIVEAYLRDLLVEAAEFDPSFMKQSEQTIEYTVVNNADSIESLARRMRNTWAKGFLESGGPRKWLAKFQRWGATGYPENMESDLELMWGIRHLMVHRAGIADTEFLDRHGDAKCNPNNGELIVSPEDIDRFSAAGINFSVTTRTFLLKRCNANSSSSV